MVTLSHCLKYEILKRIITLLILSQYQKIQIALIDHYLEI